MPFPANQVMNCFHVLHNSLAPRTCICIIASACQVLSVWPRKLCPTVIKLKQNGEFHGHWVDSLLGSLVLSSVHPKIIITNVLINQAGSYYVITNFYLIWDRSHLYLVTLRGDIIIITRPQLCYDLV